ncbi:MAG: GAF domain-containing protein [Sphaerochaetaceae bacterium]|jgi:GAF domain-containing protein
MNNNHEQLKSLVALQTFSFYKMVSSLANATAFLAKILTDINWVGFYLVQGDSLLLGPFWGEPACIELPFNKGVCGTAWALAKTQVVADVNTFAGHIVCDSTSRSEVAIPLIQKGSVVGVLDVDSPLIDRFKPSDVAFLEKCGQIIQTYVPFA